VVLTCDREFTQLGLRVTAGEDRENLLASSDDRATLLRSSGGAITIETPPLEFLRQTALLGSSGSLTYVATDTRRSDGSGRMVILRRNPDASWNTIVQSPPEEEGPHLLYDLVIFGDAVQLWLDNGLEWPSHIHVSDIYGQTTEFSYPITRGSWNRWTVGYDGWHRALSFEEGPEGWQLGMWRPSTAQVEGFQLLIGAPVPTCQPLAYRPVLPTLPQIPTPSSAPDFSVVIQHPDALRIAWPIGDESHDEFIVPGTPLAGSACTPEAAGLLIDGFGVAQTGDGRLWLAWVETRTCEPAVDGTLRVASYEFATRTLTEQLELPIDPLAPIVRTLEPANAQMLDVRAWGSSVAIGLRTREGGLGIASARLIRLETAEL
jgi:hypothetical protein